ncbi:MAG: DNA translocase FtsK 4TM domain-containing protein [Candidatus Omnitrophica bacterium]|nr:DNA translocase FtsK 4TM domain-containing protein [Candidatus Omnitrophota bacterium]
MARASKRPFFTLSPERRNELWGIGFTAMSLLLFMSLISYDPSDLSFFTSHPRVPVRNLCGVAGAVAAGLFRSTIGLTSYLVAILGILWSLARFSGKSNPRPLLKWVSLVIFCLGVSGLLSLVLSPSPEARVWRGGTLGLLAGNFTVHYFGRWGAYVVLLTLSLLSFLMVTEMAALPLFTRTGSWMWAGLALGGRKASEAVSRLKELPKSAVLKPPVLHRTRPVIRMPKASPPPPAPPSLKAEPQPAVEVSAASPAPQPKPAPRRSAPHREEAAPAVRTDFKLPGLDLLNVASADGAKMEPKAFFEANAKILEESLRDFGIEVKVAEVETGPVITRYELEPAPGVKIQKIATLSDDLALVLKAPSVRIIAPIPGKARVGIEVPNPSTANVILREVLESEEFRQTDSRIRIAIGKDTAGHPLVADLADMPHLLIAGTTGSGKTVCMNALITSILFTSTPQEVRFLMVDPKMVELAVFNGLPHLLMPVVTHAKRVPAALQWVVQEMEARYRLFAKLGLRNIQAYHAKLAAGELPAEEIPESLPYLVVIIDELADLMLVVQSEVENAIARLAHLSRAVGIHMILATQRPSVDVLTGVVKANFPARISFQVASKVDSRTVLDAGGADKLLGKGDLLFMQPGSSRLVRAQGTLVTDEEIGRVSAFWKEQQGPSYEASLMEEVPEGTRGSQAQEQVQDSLYPEAVRVIVETGQASVSLLQRRMRLGYGRAARILDRMEEEGIVGPIRGAKPREVFWKEIPEEYHVDRGTSQVRA